MKIILNFIIVFGLFLQNIFATEVKTEKLINGIIVDQDERNGRSEPCRT